MAKAAMSVLGAFFMAVTPVFTAVSQAAPSAASPPNARAALPPGAIRHVMVIDLENESESATFGSSSPATYLTHTLVPQGELLTNYYATGHVSADNYMAQVSGQAPNLVSSSDCITDLTTGAGSYNDVVPGTLDSDQGRYPGQVDGQGCVYPSSVQTIGNQLDRQPRSSRTPTWREYAEDMGNDPARDGGTPDPLGGTDCAHPAQVNGTAADNTNNAEGPNATGMQVHSAVSDQYVDRHNPFIYFHAVIDRPAFCAQHVVPLGTVTVATNGQPTAYHGHLAQDLQYDSTTPAFSFITPNVCNDGHDASCAGTNAALTTAGGLTGLNSWLTAWMPLILNSPAYRDGSMLVVITADEGAITDATAAANEQPGPGSANPGYSPLLNTPIAALGGKTDYELLGVTNLTPGVPPPPGTLPGGGQVGALLLSSKWIEPDTVNATPYNHYSALRTYEDVLGIRTGGSDGHGHLGMAGTTSLAPFGPDVFNRHPAQRG